MSSINNSELIESQSSISVIFNSDKSPLETSIKRKRPKMYLVAAAALLNGVCMGLVLGYSSPALSSFRKSTSHLHLKADEEDWFGSLMGIGALIGGFAGGPLTNYLGRKNTLILCSVLFFFGWDGIPYSNSAELLYFLRIVTGFCSGLVSSAAPMYIIEISTPKVRGFLGSCFQLSVVTGVLVAMSLGLYFAWSWLSVCCAIISILSLLCILPMPESPRWLVMKNKKIRAIVAIKFLQGDRVDLQKEFENIENDIKRQPQGSIGIKDFVDPINWKPFLLSLGLMYFQQFSGVNGIMFYASSIFESTGNKSISDNSPVIVAAVQVFATFMASILMDKAGRKLLLLICGIGTTISLTTMGFYFYFAEIYGKSYQVQYSWISLVSLVVFIASFSIGMGPIPWLMVAEMVPQRVRSLVSAVATGFNWTLVFIITFNFAKMSIAFHPYGVYWFYASNCFLCVLFSWFILPETKGKKLEDIQKLFKRSSLSFRTKSTTGNDLLPIIENDIIMQSD
ncbi:solute carrier family 2, facilitated glucose transporter member 8-like [Centruroides vittatus]|uniref:solute carrier family 2, facilitated glucose transporter member 8-like n=1 Tax=Centruroides vittatus TaxID=120091 RepID=UPI00350F9150